MRKKIDDFIELDDLRDLLRKECGIKLNRTGVYFYIKNHNFPLPVGLSRPRKWEKNSVLAWVKKRKSK